MKFIRKHYKGDEMKKKLKTIKEYEAEQRKIIKERNLSGIECPHCKTELEWVSGWAYPTRLIICPKCKYRTNIYNGNDSEVATTWI